MKKCEYFRAQLIDERLAEPSEIVGCTEEDVKVVERLWGTPVPAAYRELLLSFGRSAGKFMTDCNVFYPEILELKEEAHAILEIWEEGELELPPNAVVFVGRRGEQFAFFVTEAGSDDPPVYFYVEGAGRFDKRWSSIWHLLDLELASAASFRREFPDSTLHS